MRTILRIGNGQGILTMKPTTALIMALSKLEGQRVWESKDRLRLFLSRGNIAVLEQAVGSVSIVDAPSGQLGETYAPKVKPFEHQAKAIAKAYPVLKKTNAFALYQEPGTGKTKTAIDLAGMLWTDGSITGLLVVAPKGVHRQWVDDQLPRHAAFPYDALRWPTKETSKLNLTPENGKLKILSMNIDGIKTAAGRGLIERMLTLHKGRVLFVLDESHTVKNKTSGRWAAAKAIGDKCKYRLAMTGTPVANNLVDVWSQFSWLDEHVFNIKYVTHFRNEFCIMGGFEGKEIVGHKNVDRFKAIIEPYSFVTKKEELGVLPKTYSQWFFDLEPSQIEMIKTMKELLLAQIDSGQIATAQNAAVAMIRLQQISSGFLKDEDGTTHRLFSPMTDNPRMKALSEIVDAYKDQQLVIWARFREDVKMIKHVFGAEVAEYYGETSEKERQISLAEFKAGKRRFFVSNPAAGGTGLDGLQGVCSHAIYYSHDDSLINRTQSEDRIHRIGTKGATVFIDMIAKKSTDSRILRNVRAKKTLSSMTMGDIRAMLMDVAASDALEIFNAPVSF